MPDLLRHFKLARPSETHFEPATCKEMDCPHYLHGWVMTLDMGFQLGNGKTGQDQYDYIKHKSGRRFTEKAVGDGRVELTFAPGQTCFRSHIKPIAGKAIVMVQTSNHERTVYREAEHFTDDMNQASYETDKARKAG